MFEAARRRDAIGNVVVVIWILAVAARLILIDQPYVDHWSWRQSDVAGIARNFYDGGFRFAYPQIDWAGDATGYVGTELPILPFIAAICYKFAGIHEWIGRSQAVIFFAVSLPFFFLLVREIFGSTAAVWATFFFSFTPLNIFAGRSFMPDVPSLSLAIIGLYFFVRWIHDQKWTAFFAAAIAISLSILIKVTSIVIAAPLLYLAVAALSDRRRNKERRFSKPPGRSAAFARLRRAEGERSSLNLGAHRAPLQLIAFVAITVVPSAIWYWHAYQIAQRFYPHHFFGAGGIRIENFSWYWHVGWQTAVSSITPVLAIMALIGLFVPQSWDRKYSRLLHWWLVAVILFIIAVGYGNRHRWYQLPMVPITAGFAGAACAFFASKISSRPAAIILSILSASSFAILSYVYVRPLYESSAAQLRNAGLALNKIAPSDALIVAADMGDPTIFYYSQRKGWHFLEEDGIYQGTPSDSQDAIVDLEKLRRRGATHVVFTRNTLWWLDYYPEFAQRLAQSATVMAASPEFKIYKFDVTAR
jgi:4-amino-4-deoxy-L-arabinose transferase-like glycosyltransferase